MRKKLKLFLLGMSAVLGMNCAAGAESEFSAWEETSAAVSLAEETSARESAGGEGLTKEADAEPKTVPFSGEESISLSESEPETASFSESEPELSSSSESEKESSGEEQTSAESGEEQLEETLPSEVPETQTDLTEESQEEEETDWESFFEEENYPDLEEDSQTSDEISPEEKERIESIVDHDYLSGEDDNDDLFTDYVASVFQTDPGLFSDDSSDSTSNANGSKYLGYNNLTSTADKMAYVEVMKMATRIANGSSEKSCVTVTFTYAQYQSLSTTKVFYALLYDNPYCLYWFCKSEGWKVTYNVSGNIVKANFYLYMASDYAANYITTVTSGSSTFKMPMTPNTAKTGAAYRAAQNAANVVAQAANLSDYQKLVYYRNWICNAVTYDDYAASISNSTTRENPWQLINAFDGDSSTNIVCEGYSKAFMYLCEQSEFQSPDLYCYLVDGNNHMWNLVHMPNGYNYIVDVTNCDSGCTGYPDKLFLVGTSGSPKTGYTICKVKYIYDSDDWKTYTTEQLTVASSNYDPSDQRGYESIKTGFYRENGKILYYVKGSVASGVNDLVYDSVSGNWYKVSAGIVDSGYTGLAFHDGTWYYVTGGILDWDYVGLTQYNGVWYYVSGGVLGINYTGLTLYNGTWYYITAGGLDWNYTGMVFCNDAWYYVEGGVLNWGYTGLTLYNGTWYYVEGGVLNWGYTGLTLYNGTWYYVEGGVLNWGYTGLTLYNGTWYYVEGGVLNWNYTGLTFYNETWFFVRSGVVDWDFEGIVKYNSSKFYVHDGSVDWTFSGTLKSSTRIYTVKNGVVTAEKLR